MKKKIATLALTLTSAFAQDTVSRTDLMILPQQERTQKHSYVYVRTDVTPVASAGVLPGLGVGYRLGSSHAAIDFSASAARGERHSHYGNVWTLPRVNYLYYLMPQEDNSLYIGGGLALGGVETSNSDFKGMIANAAVGYELQRKERFRSFIQCDLNQPAVAAESEGAFPGPYVAFSLGAGF